ncbi:hypothetical protein Nstercoris_00158 [Nitrosomonas stercoris]|uniref:Winged helix-turn-helix domain-containing protein n=1 Tax=Nitrosomonas stercoris TaxID=1444684 RepID=A0A4Y1YLN9_9PROT|nr:hypothetical protein Nstercoris_00158 [Nitrosomonas stercoris]
MKRQERAVLDLLREQPLSTFELRERGYLIDTVHQTEFDGHGHRHYAVARYFLRGEQR